MKKIKCKVCSTKFDADKETKYIATEKSSPLSALTTATNVFECFDCPACGCQNVAGIRMQKQDEEECDE